MKTFLQKVTLQIGLKKFLQLKKLKILFCGHMLLEILIVGMFYEKELKKTKQKKIKQIKQRLELKK